MLYRFAEVELDGTRRELRVSGASVALQPQAFAVLEYLLQHRERVVSKTELLTTLWHGVHVGEASLQKAISLARTAIETAVALLQHQHSMARAKALEEAGNKSVQAFSALDDAPVINAFGTHPKLAARQARALRQELAKAIDKGKIPDADDPEYKAPLDELRKNGREGAVVAALTEMLGSPEVQKLPDAERKMT